MANADPTHCPSCGAERLADAPGGLCPRCVLRHAMESDSSYDSMPAPGSSRLGPVLEALTLTAGSAPRIRLFDPETTAGDDDDESDPAVRLGSAEMPAAPSDAVHLELLGEIARGGMGSVLKGRDPDLGRDLAVKVLLETHKDKPDLLRRFLEEAQIAGQLQHPGVVPVYELGAFADQRPYFTMKLVKGRTMASLLDARGGSGDELPRFLSIFEQVCRTMAYAHSRGVIHRDLKPSNIMVGGFGEVQVMDWGLAKVLASGGVADESRAVERLDQVSVVRTLRTGSDADASQAGSVMGTPAYMPPEQAGGDIEALDERADVFGLGAILCEVMTGSPPYTGPDGNAVFRKALRGDLADAFERLDACGAESELIDLAKSCLAAELFDRPRDARIVADRLTDYLSGVQERLRTAELARAAESARALEAVRKARAERRARRLTAGLAAAVFVAMALGGGGAAWLVSVYNARRAVAARETAEILDRVIVLRAKARAAPPDTVISWNEALAEANRAADRVRDLADPEQKGQIARLIVELEQGRQNAEIQAERLGTDRKLLSELEAVRGNRAEHFDPKRTDGEYAAAFRQAGLNLDATDPKPVGAWIVGRSAPVELALFLDDWAMVRRAAGGDDKAVGRLVEAARAADPDPWRDALRTGLETKVATALKALHKLAGDEKALESQPAESLRLLAKRLKAAGDRDGATRLLRRAWRLRPHDYWVNFELALSPGAESGTIEEVYPRPEEGVRHLTAAVAVRPGSHIAHNTLGGALHRQGKHDEAIAEYRAAIRLKPDLAEAHTNLGNALADQGKLGEAIAEYCIAIRLKPDYATAHTNLGNALQNQGKLDEAIAEQRAAIRLKPDYALAHINLGNALHIQGKHDEAMAEYRIAIRLQPDDAGVHNNLGLALMGQGNDDAAISEYRIAIRLQPDDALAHANLGNALHAQRKPDEAISEYRIAIRLQPDAAGAHANLGFALDSVGQRAAAIAAWRESVRLRPEQANVHYWIGRALLLEERTQEAVEAFRQVLALYPAGSQQAQEARQVLSGSNPYARLWGIVKGTDHPKDAEEAILFANMARMVAQYGAAARLLAGALKADPKLGDNRQTWHRYNAACAAALAGCGKGKDDPPPDETARARLRIQSLDWLKAELTAWGKVVDKSDPSAQAVVTQILQHWKVDTDLTGIRDGEALSKLPEAERKAWQSLWADVDRLFQRAVGGKP
jgi:tetratricopeptide (TPR) repeat protein